MDTNIKDTPKMITGSEFLAGLDQTISRPLRLVPFFDPGIWDGQWMKNIFGLDKDKENSLYLKYDDIMEGQRQCA